MSKKRNFRSLLPAFFFLLFFGCSDNSEKESVKLNTVDFGKVQYYNPFLWVKSDIPKTKNVLVFDFNNHAINEGASLSLQLVEDNGKPVIKKDGLLKMYVDDHYCADGKFMINTSSLPKNGEVCVEIEFLPGLSTKTFVGFLVVKETNLDRINNQDFFMNDTKIMKWQARYEKVFNPLALGIFWAIIIIIICVFIWFLILRDRIYPKIKSGVIQIQSPYFESVKLNRAMKVIFSDHQKKQRLSEKFWKGKIISKANVVWTHDFILSRGKKKGQLKYKLPYNYIIKSIDNTPMGIYLDRYKSYEIINDNKEKIIIQVN